MTKKIPIDLLSWIEIKKSNILHNLNTFQKLTGAKVEVIPVIKSNAYGHGMVSVAKLVSPQVNFFAVVNIDEAKLLRRKGIKKKIIVLSYYSINLSNFKWASNNNIHLALHDITQLNSVLKYSSSLDHPLNLHLKIETGTNRLGLNFLDLQKAINRIMDHKKLNIYGLFSHFAASEELPKFTQKQLTNFCKLIKFLDINPKMLHFACSAAAIDKIDSHLNAIRLGISLYGLWPSGQLKQKYQRKISLKPALSWYCRLIHVKKVQKGDTIGYGCTYKVIKNGIIGVLPIGYWEGYDRLLSNNGEVIIRNTKCPIRGRICMNLTMVDLSKIPQAKVGDKVIVIGSNRAHSITADDIAEKTNTINYEVVTRINQSIPRFYT